jgi:hypothetical protein
VSKHTIQHQFSISCWSDSIGDFVNPHPKFPKWLNSSVKLTLKAASTIGCKVDFCHVKWEKLLVDDTLGTSNFVLILKNIIHQQHVLCPWACHPCPMNL